MRISFVTYTYNDHSFAAELLRLVRSFPLPFHEFLVIDDASAEPFALEKGGEEIRVLRLPRNVGPGKAKSFGIEATTGDVVLSMDADIRITPPWLRQALSYLTDPTVGLVGVKTIPIQADNYLSRALHATANRHRHDTNAPFLSGEVWLFRKDVWNALGGLKDFAETTHEDVWYCGKVRQAGLRLVRAMEKPVYEKRRLHRIAYCNREIRYFAVPMARGIAAQGLEATADHLRSQLASYREFAESNNEKAILYIEFLRGTALLIAALTGPATGSCFSRERVLCGARAFAQRFPRFAALLDADLEALGFKPATGWPAPSPWLEFEQIYAPVLPASLLAELDAEWVAKLQAEDAQATFDTHYLDAAPDFS